MDVVVVQTEPAQQGMETKGALEIRDDGDRRTGADQQRFLAPLVRQRALGSGQRFHVPVERDGRRAGMVGEFGPAIRRHARGDVVAKGFSDFFGLLTLDQTERDFSRGFRRNDSLRALPGIAANDPVDVAGWARRELLDQQPVLLTGGDRQPDRFEEGFRREIELLPLRQNVWWQILYAVIEAGDRDAAVVVGHAAAKAG